MVLVWEYSRTYVPQELRADIFLLALLGLFLLVVTPVLADAGSGSPKNQLEEAWQRATRSGRYSYEADVLQTIHPTARLENVGRRAQTQHLSVSGDVDVHNEAMLLELQAGDKQPLALKIEDGAAYGRVNECKRQIFR